MLDEDGLTWAGTVARAWRRVADFSGGATRGEFWGYVAAWVTVWLLVRATARPADAVVAVVGAFALASLTVRRLHAMATAEIAGIGLVLVLGAARLALG